MAKCYRCGTTENLTDYEYWGRVEWYCDRCYDEMEEESRKEVEEMGERKIHVLKDGDLGGVLREYVEVDRRLEPTDIVHIDDPSGQSKRYRMVERRVSIGEKVLITVDSELKGEALTVSGFDSDGDLVFKESDYYYAKHGDYVVLEAVEQSPPVLDMLANLSEQIVKLNRRIDRLADANEQAITTVARDVERVDADIIKLRKEFEDSNDVKLTLSSELVAKLIEKGLSE